MCCRPSSGRNHWSVPPATNHIAGEWHHEDKQALSRGARHVQQFVEWTVGACPVVWRRDTFR